MMMMNNNYLEVLVNRQDDYYQTTTTTTSTANRTVLGRATTNVGQFQQIGNQIQLNASGSSTIGGNGNGTATVLTPTAVTFLTSAAAVTDLNMNGIYQDLFSYWKEFRITDLKNDLDIYMKQIETNKNQQFDLNNKFRIIQNTLFNSMMDKSACQNLVLDFQNQLNGLNHRICLTENLVTNLVKFFSNMSKFIDANNNNTELSHEPENNENNVSSGGGSGGNSERSSKQNRVYIQPYDLTNIEVPDESTEEVARKIKEYLQISKISQRKFSETLLNMKQANFSALLSQPVAWSQLSKTYRDRFLIMYLWLNDPFRVDKINNLMKLKAVTKNQKYSMSNDANDTSTDENDKRKRLPLTNEQTDKLKSQFIKNPYPSSFELDLIAVELNLDPKKVATWFTHQRQIYKIQNKRK